MCSEIVAIRPPIKRLLRAVAVVERPSRRRRRGRSRALEPLGNERLVGEEAEPVRLGGLRMVTGWPHERVGDSRAALEHRVGCLDRCRRSGRQGRPRPRRRRRLREAAAAAPAPPRSIAGLDLVHDRELVELRQPARVPAHVRGDRAALEHGLHVEDALDVLGGGAPARRAAPAPRCRRGRSPCRARAPARPRTRRSRPRSSCVPYLAPRPLEGDVAVIETVLQRARQEDGNTPVLEDWGITSEYGVLRDVLVGSPDAFRWLGEENAVLTPSSGRRSARVTASTASSPCASTRRWSTPTARPESPFTCSSRRTSFRTASTRATRASTRSGP